MYASEVITKVVTMRGISGKIRMRGMRRKEGLADNCGGRGRKHFLQ